MTTTATKERPILFRPELVRAILDGPKRVTRRPVKPQPTGGTHAERMPPDSVSFDWYTPGTPRQWHCTRHSPYGAPGDHLWVRETWALAGNEDGHLVRLDGSLCDDEREAARLYRADTTTGAYGLPTWPSGAQYGGRWRPSIFMPRWACRLVLRNDDTRAERLLEITEEDALAEGLPSRAAFLAGWDRLYGKRPELQSAANPWVWRVEFSVVEPTP